MSNYTVVLSANRTQFLAAEDIAADVRRSLHDKLWRRPNAFPPDHSADYYRKVLNGERALSLTAFIWCLFAVKRIGDFFAAGTGTEWVRRILTIIARPFGLRVEPDSQHVIKPAPDAERDTHRAVAKLTTTNERVWADGRKDRDEAADLEADAIAAKAAIDALVVAR